ncbi:MAG: hypothetical protein KatS3mg077_0552 [Candidatus Binatia bacterium]|nr:MAG: hypothetical protein KatS3mg077_0552 [Candidatus Binatia bacterium]
MPPVVDMNEVEDSFATEVVVLTRITVMVLLPALAIGVCFSSCQAFCAAIRPITTSAALGW